jgi:hypothetical protein
MEVVLKAIVSLEESRNMPLTLCFYQFKFTAQPSSIHSQPIEDSFPVKTVEDSSWTCSLLQDHWLNHMAVHRAERYTHASLYWVEEWDLDTVQELFRT